MLTQVHPLRNIGELGGDGLCEHLGEPASIGPMSYTRTALGGIDSVLDVAKAVVEDPCLIPVSQMALRIHELHQLRSRAPARPAPAKPGSPSAPTPVKPAKPAPPVKGIGLCNAVKPLKVVVWAYEHPWVAPVGAAAVVAGLVGLGYLIGRRA